MLSECLERVGHCGTDTDGDVRMDVVIRRPERFIPDANVRRRVLGLPECQTYALVHRVVPLLEEKGIAVVLQWGGAEESADARRAVRDALVDDWLWNTTCGLLDAAFSAARDAGARERTEMERTFFASNVAVEVVPGAFESVVNAKWSHVLSGVSGMPLAMRVVDSLPENVWPDAEVNKTPAPWPTENDDEARGEALELLVLTSDKGWPYTRFRPCSERDVFVRREVLRVWHVVRRD
ncbi:putative retrotransposon hot spot protein 4 (RHS4) [Trypanosoma vivax]|nr:putative retrotransposon hot spot protein 4 (RHS4) [Trypanosoma vivax]